MMKMSEYRKLVAKSGDVKGAKMGLRYLTRNTKSTQITSSVIQLVNSAGDLTAALSPYLTGAQFTDTMREGLKGEMSSFGHDLIVLARLLKVKTPTPTKKIKMEFSRTVNYLALLNTVHSINQILVGMALTPHTKFVEKEVVLPSEGGKKEVRQVRELDAEKQDPFVADCIGIISVYLNEVVRLFWGLSLDMFGEPPAFLFELNAALLAPAVPEPVVVTKGKGKKKAA